jgi:hypothetical protein
MTPCVMRISQSPATARINFFAASARAIIQGIEKDHASIYPARL